jgi:hypothetical protein
MEVAFFSGPLFGSQQLRMHMPQELQSHILRSHCKEYISCSIKVAPEFLYIHASLSPRASNQIKKMQTQFFAKLQGEPCRMRTLSSGKLSEQSAKQVMRNAGLRSALGPHRKALRVIAQAANKGTPPDVPKPRGQPQGGKEWLQTILSRFGPVKEKASNTTVLDFEKPLVELDNRIKEVGYIVNRSLNQMYYVPMEHAYARDLIYQSGLPMLAPAPF